MRRIVSAILQNPRAHAYLRGLYAEIANLRGAPAQTVGVETSIGELFPLPARHTNEASSVRFNLLVPALSVKHVFGGINTALNLFDGLIGEQANARIILTDEQTFEHADNPAYSSWTIRSLDDDDHSGRSIVPAGDRYGKSLPVTDGDYFLSTAWWTAALANQFIDWQHEHFKTPGERKFAYLIQDFEPGFYAWSSRYALADATYRTPERIVPIFNTSLLKSFFQAEGYQFEDPLHFEPRLHAGLRQSLTDRPEAARPPREKQILIYGRPKVARNAFALIVQGLTQWIAQGNSTGWKFVSVGEEHPPVDLGFGQQLTSLGKLTIEGYADELFRSSIGLSLMVSPHPSYPPMEMAAFGMQVITNTYKNKDLSDYFANVESLQACNPEQIARLLNKLTTHTPTRTTAPSGRFNEYLESGDNVRLLGPIIRQRLLAQ